MISDDHRRNLPPDGLWCVPFPLPVEIGDSEMTAIAAGSGKQRGPALGYESGRLGHYNAAGKVWQTAGVNAVTSRNTSVACDAQRDDLCRGMDFCSSRLFIERSDLQILQRYLALDGSDAASAHKKFNPGDRLQMPKARPKSFTRVRSCASGIPSSSGRGPWKGSSRSAP